MATKDKAREEREEQQGQEKEKNIDQKTVHEDEDEHSEYHPPGTADTHMCILGFCELLYACKGDPKTCPYTKRELVEKEWKQTCGYLDGKYTVVSTAVPNDPKWLCPQCKKEFAATGEVRNAFGLYRPSASDPKVMEDFATSYFDEVTHKEIKLPPLPQPRDPIARAAFDRQRFIEQRTRNKAIKFQRRKTRRALNKLIRRRRR